MNDFSPLALEQELLKRISYLEQIVNLQRETGWVYLVEHFTQVINAVKDGLLAVTSAEELTRLQERYRAYSSMLQAVSEFQKELDQKRRELDELRADIKDGEQFSNL